MKNFLSLYFDGWSDYSIFDKLLLILLLPFIAILQFLFISVFIFSPLTASASVAITDDFESYSVGTGNLLNGAGGSGWSGAWSNGSVYSSPTKTGSRSAGDSGQNYALQRYWTANEAGSITLYVRNYSASDNAAIYIQSQSSNNIIILPCYTGGVFRYYMDSSYLQTANGTCAANTWYKIDIEWDDTNQADKWRFRIDDGSWYGWGTTFGTYSTFDNIKIWSAASGATYVDDISSTDISATTTEESTATSTLALRSTESMSILVVLSLSVLAIFYIGHIILK